MKVLDPILASEVPDRKYGRKPRNPEYDNVLIKAQRVAMAKVLPIECESLPKAKLLYGALRTRIKMDNLLLHVFRNGNVVYLQRVSK